LTFVQQQSAAITPCGTQDETGVETAAIAMARRGQAGRRPADPVNGIVTSETAASEGPLGRRRR
jgi:hypothetical protein